MAANYFKDDPVFGTIDLDDEYITDAFVVDRYVGNQLYGWGCGYFGTLGLGQGGTFDAALNRSSPVQISPLTNWKLVSANSYHCCAIKTDGTLWSWGRNQLGQLGQNNITHRSSPVQVGSLSDWKTVSCGYASAGAIKTDGTLWTWGNNNNGRIGVNNTTNRSSPTQVGTLTNWKMVSVASYHTAAIKTDGTLWAIGGTNSYGSLGLGDITDRSSPVQVGTGTSWKMVSASNTHTSAIKTDGTLWIWGRNNLGQLGLGDITNRSSPVQVGSLTSWKDVSCGRKTTNMIKTDGTLWACGYNNNNYLGLGTAGNINRSSPVQIGTLTNWKTVSTGTTNAAAIKTDGTLWWWGNNAQGVSGGAGGAWGPRTSPVQIGALNNWKLLAAGAYTIFATTFADIV